MNTLAVLTILSIFQLCCSNFAEVNHPIHKSKGSPNKRKDNFNRIKSINEPMKANNERQYNVYKSLKTKPDYAILKKPHYVKGSLVGKNVIHKAKFLPTKHQGKVIKHPKEARSPKEEIHKRHFEKPIRYYRHKIKELKRNKVSNDYGPTYRYVLTEATESNFNNDQPKSFEENSSLGNKDEFFENLNTNPWEKAEQLATKKHSMNVQRQATLSSSLAPTWSTSPSTKQNSLQIFTQNSTGYQDSTLYQDMSVDTNENYEQSFTTSSVTTAPPTYIMGFHQADIIERNLEIASRWKKNWKSDSPGDDSEIDDTVISFDEGCDRIDNQTCSIRREVGDVVTLALKINSSKELSSFEIRWMKLYHKFDSDKGTPHEIEPEKLPWNMVSGSEGRELRLNPVDNSDTDPNCFIAQVFLVKNEHGKMLFTKLKELIFRIEIPVIDMGKLYAGEEVNINIENFISLPERGNLLFQWNLETKPHEYESLPSNIKVSPSGRSVLLKELKRGRLGILNCVIYSSNRYAIAKRRFNIFKIVDNIKRRSAMIDLSEDHHDLIRRRRCSHLIMRSREDAKQKLIDGNKPKSRKKRFRRMELVKRQLSELDCEPLMKKLHSRSVRSAYSEFTTEDSRLMPLEKLLELSEEGDGSLDDVIPSEVHYVNPKVKLISGTAKEKSADHPISTNCTSHSDCTENALCVLSEEESNDTEHLGNCYCRSEFYRDGTECLKIPLSNHREKRLNRNARKDLAVPKHLFYKNSEQTLKTVTEIMEEDEETETPTPKVLAFEEEASFLLTNCIGDKDCSMHANCVQPTNGHPYCKCGPGFRGNGIFCWEMMDYVPAEEHDEEINILDKPLEQEMSIARKTFIAVEPPED